MDNASAKAHQPIPPNPPRWRPNPDPTTIDVPGLDVTASINDQIEQIEHLITIKLQARI
jgi:DASH complex subunit ASK1